MPGGLRQGAGGALKRRNPARGMAVWLPCVLVVVLAWPSVGYMLPACASHLGENYQPLRALKFASSMGREYHKWGPMPNLLLLPGYAASIGYWWATDEFTGPSDEFPYGLTQPLEQLSFLIVQGRVLFLVLGVVLLGWFIADLRLIAAHRGAVFLAAMLCLATSYVVLRYLPNTRPDGPALAFSAGALAVYMRIVKGGLTVRRGFFLPLFAVFAISSKELAATMFVLPYVGLLWCGRRGSGNDAEARRKFVHAAAVMLATGVIAYAVLNIVYAPGTWWQRMQFWLGGEGKDSAVWGGGIGAGLSMLGYLRLIGAAWLNNLGPGGAVVALLALGAFFAARPKRWVLLLLPLLSVQVLGVGPMGYVTDRFYLIPALCLTPIVASGLSVVLKKLEHRAARGAMFALLALAVAANLDFATFSWHELEAGASRMMERHAQAHVGEDETINVLDEHPGIEGKSRLARLGFNHDIRALQEIVDDPQQRPDWIYTTAGKLQFIEDCALYPQRAEMLRKGSGFEFERWPGMAGLGYRLEEEIRPTTPGWFAFDWMPAVQKWRRLGGLRVYRHGAAPVGT